MGGFVPLQVAQDKFVARGRAPRVPVLGDSPGWRGLGSGCAGRGGHPGWGHPGAFARGEEKEGKTGRSHEKTERLETQIALC